MKQKCVKPAKQLPTRRYGKFNNLIMKHSLQRIKIYKINGITLSKERGVDEQIVSQKYKLTNHSFIGETRIISDIDYYNDIYYTKIVLGNSLLVGFPNNDEKSSLKDILESNKNLEKEKNENCVNSNQLYLLCTVKSSQDLNKIDIIKSIDKYYYTIQGWPEISDQFKNESESVMNTIVAFTNAAIMNKYIHPSLEILNEFIYFKHNTNKIVFDFYLSGSAHAIQTKHYDGRKLRPIKKKAESISTNLKDLCKIDKLYVKMLEEKDPLKKFLFGYYCIEVIINKTYNLNTNRSRIDRKLSNISDIEIKKELSTFLSNEIKFNIRHKFIINSSLIWTGINSNSYNDFLEIKKVRDKISHGSFDYINNLPVYKVESVLSILIENYHAITT